MASTADVTETVDPLEGDGIDEDDNLQTPEPIEGDDTEESDAEDSPAPDEPGSPSPEDIERQMEKLQRENDRHTKRVSEIMGDAATDLDQCPRCAGFVQGWIWPPAIAPLSAEQLEAVKASIGEAVTEPLRAARDAFQCDTCSGMGVVVTGSHVSGQETLNCDNCLGRGWMGPRSDAAARNAAGAASAAIEATGAAPEPAPDVDPWGREPSDPNFGRLPQFVRA